MGAQDGRDPVEDYRIINEELVQYQMRLGERPQVVVANKMDLDDAQENLKRFKEAYPDVEVFEACTIIAEGMEKVLYRVADLLEVTPEFPIVNEEEKEEGVLYKFEAEKPAFEIFNLGNGQWRLEGERLFKLFEMTDFKNEHMVYRFSNTLRKMGVDDALRNAGCKDGDLISIKDFAFEFMEEE